MARRVILTDSTNPILPAVVVAATAATDADMADAATDRFVTPDKFPFRIIAPSGGDDTAMIQAAADSLAENGWLYFRGDRGNYAIASGVTFGKINIQMPSAEDEGKLVYSGTGTAVTITGANGCHIQMTVHRTSRLWDTTDSTSKGIRCVNTQRAHLMVDVRYFNIAVECVGDNGGFQYNLLDVDLLDNKKGIKATKIGTGWTNQNTVQTGRIAYFSGAASYVGTVSLDLDVSNGWTFTGLGLEGGVHEKSFVVGGNSNVFVNCRYEQNVNGALEFTSTSSFCQVIGGYNLIGSTLIADAGLYNNVIAGSYVSHAFGQTGYNAKGMLLKSESGLSTVLLTLMQSVTTDNTKIEMLASGTVNFYDASGKEGNTVPQMQLFAGTGTLGGIQFGSGATALVGRIYAHNTSFLAMVGSWLWPTDATYDIGTATQRPRDFFLSRNLRWGGALDHDGTTVGFRGATPVVMPTAYTQTYATASRTHAAYTSDPESSAYTGAADSEAKLADLNALRVAYENLRVAYESTSQVLNSLIDDLQLNGLLQ